MSPLKRLSALLVILLPGCVQFEAASTEVLLVPRLERAPVLDRWIGEDEWARASLLEGTFFIEDGTEASGEYPFQLRMGADDEALYIAATFPNTTANPWTELDEQGYGTWHPDGLVAFFLMGHEGPLTPPADLKLFTGVYGQGSSTNDGYWTGSEWTGQPEGPGGSFRDGRPEGGTWGRSGYTNDSIFWEIYINRTSLNKAHDGLQLGKNAEFRMALMFFRAGGESPSARGMFAMPHDTYPGEGYTPDNHYHPETWLKLRLES